MLNKQYSHKEDISDCQSQEYVRNLSARDFEIHCKNILKGFAAETGLQDFRIEHDVKVDTHDGNYQIDVLAVFHVDLLEFRLLCECKQHKNSIKREYVTILNQKLQSLGFHKGVLMTTSSFQSGAIEFAKEHGIALIKVYDYRYDFLSHSSSNSIEEPNDPFIVAERMMPPVRANYYDFERDEPVLVYPTHAMVDEILAKQKTLLMEHGLL